MSGHKQQPVANPFTGRQVDIDQALVPVLENLWSRDIETISSCQGHPGYGMAVICFADPRGYDENPDAPDDPDDWSNADMDAWDAAQPSGARQLRELLAASGHADLAVRWTWNDGGADDPNPGSAVL